jgi:hypothetical protein
MWLDHVNSGGVNLYNLSTRTLDRTLSPGSPATSCDGYPLEWSHETKGQVASAGMDGKICVWDIGAAGDLPLQVD